MISMKNNLVLEFINNDSEYLEWIKNHPEGYVINTSKSKTPSYMILHRAYCSLISEYSETRKKGGFTEREYIKVCADNLEMLHTWLRSHGRLHGRFSSECACTRMDDDYLI